MSALDGTSNVYVGLFERRTSVLAVALTYKIVECGGCASVRRALSTPRAAASAGVPSVGAVF
jgi:hypothetical protein